MATKYSFNIDSPFIQSSQPKPGDRTSSNPFGLSFGGYYDAYTKMSERLNQQMSDNLKSQYSFLDNKAMDKLNPQNQFKKDTNTEEKKKFNLGKTLLKGVSTLENIGLKGGELFGKAMSIAEPFLHKDEIPENKNAQLSNNIGNTIAKWAPTLGPLGWVYSGFHALAQSTGGMSNGSNTGNTLVDGANTLLGVIPGVGWGISKSPEAYRSALTESSAMYGNSNLFAQEHGGGKYAIGKGDIDSRISQDNINTYTIEKDILEPSLRSFAEAVNDINYYRQKNELDGGLNTVTNFGVSAKHGAILQFGKRTLSKHKIKNPI